MIFEVIGIYERNKGALLMLEALREKLSAEGLNPVIGVPVIMPRAERERLNVIGVLPRKGDFKTTIMNLLPGSVLRQRGLVKADDVDVVLDASGFGYGDFWGESKLRRRLVERLDGWVGAGRVAIMLPQALGPFSQQGIAGQFRKALDLVDLAFVRDEASMAHVRAVSQSPSIRRAPDFTNLLHPPVPASMQHLIGSNFIIPNEKMVAGDRSAQRTAYVEFMATAANLMRARGLTPRILVHEGIKDQELAAEINASAAEKMEVVDVPSPLDTKALIAASNLIVSSRFHGLVSALAAGVPALACGWSHKYAELMSDYKSADMMVSIDRPAEWTATVENFLDRATDADFRKTITAAAEEQRHLSKAMWDEALATIRGKTRSTS